MPSIERQYQNEIDDLRAINQALLEVAEEAPCKCKCKRSKKAEKLSNASPAPCGQLPDEEHPNRVWCRRCKALKLAKGEA